MGTGVRPAAADDSEPHSASGTEPIAIRQIRDGCAGQPHFVPARRDARRPVALEMQRKLWQQELEFSIARQIQQRFFPAAAPPLRGFDIYGAALPAHAAGGDYFDYLPMPDGDLGVVIADASGHGVGAALVMAVLHAYLRALSHTCSDPGRILERTNEFLLPDTLAQQFATAFFLRLTPRRSVVYAGAGHESYLCRRSGEFITLDASGPPLGLLEGLSYPVFAPLELREGDVLLLATDGLAESFNAARQMFGKERLLSVLRESRGGTARAIADRLFQAVRNFAAGVPPHDDQAVVVIKAATGECGTSPR